MRAHPGAEAAVAAKAGRNLGMTAAPASAAVEPRKVRRVSPKRGGGDSAMRCLPVRMNGEEHEWGGLSADKVPRVKRTGDQSIYPLFTQRNGETAKQHSGQLGE